MQFRFFILLIILVGIAAFALQNSVPTNINLWFWNLESSPAVIILIYIAGGAIISSLLSIPNMLKKRKEISILKKEIKTCQKTITMLQEHHEEVESKDYMELDEVLT